jgi:hypothetical protein
VVALAVPANSATAIAKITHLAMTQSCNTGPPLCRTGILRCL